MSQRRIGMSPLLGYPYGPNPDKLKAYCKADAQQMVDAYKNLYPELERFQREVEARRKWIQDLKKNNRRNKKRRERSGQ